MGDDGSVAYVKSIHVECIRSISRLIETHEGFESNFFLPFFRTFHTFFFISPFVTRSRFGLAFAKRNKTETIQKYIRNFSAVRDMCFVLPYYELDKIQSVKRPFGNVLSRPNLSDLPSRAVKNDGSAYVHGKERNALAFSRRRMRMRGERERKEKHSQEAKVSQDRLLEDCDYKWTGTCTWGQLLLHSVVPSARTF